jgi:hypothetical protein
MNARSTCETRDLARGDGLIIVGLPPPTGYRPRPGALNFIIAQQGGFGF